jgi:hypothetical protein
VHIPPPRGAAYTSGYYAAGGYEDQDLVLIDKPQGMWFIRLMGMGPDPVMPCYIRFMPFRLNGELRQNFPRLDTRIPLDFGGRKNDQVPGIFRSD